MPKKVDEFVAAEPPDEAFSEAAAPVDTVAPQADTTRNAAIATAIVTEDSVPQVQTNWQNQLAKLQNKPQAVSQAIRILGQLHPDTDVSGLYPLHDSPEQVLLDTFVALALSKYDMVAQDAEDSAVDAAAARIAARDGIEVADAKAKAPAIPAFNDFAAILRGLVWGAL